MNNTTINSQYYIDSSALIRIFRFYPAQLRTQIWDKLANMFNSGELVSHRLVYDEITTNSKNQDMLSKSITPYRDSFQTLQFEQSIIVRDIIMKFPALIDPSREKDQADPWLIALVVLNKNLNPNQKYFIVSEESESKPNKIPSVCRHYKIEHLNLENFYNRIGLSFTVNSK